MSVTKEKSKVSKLPKAYQDSEKPIVSSYHMVTSTVASFDENETAQMLRILGMLNSSFPMEGSERKLREHIVPEVLDAYLSTDHEVLTMSGY